MRWVSQGNVVASVAEGITSAVQQTAVQRPPAQQLQTLAQQPPQPSQQFQQTLQPFQPRQPDYPPPPAQPLPETQLQVHQQQQSGEQLGPIALRFMRLEEECRSFNDHRRATHAWQVHFVAWVEEQLNKDWNGLAQMSQELQVTKQELQATKVELHAARQELQQLQQRFAQQAQAQHSQEDIQQLQGVLAQQRQEFDYVHFKMQQMHQQLQILLLQQPSRLPDTMATQDSQADAQSPELQVLQEGPQQPQLQQQPPPQQQQPQLQQPEQSPRQDLLSGDGRTWVSELAAPDMKASAQSAAQACAGPAAQDLPQATQATQATPATQPPAQPQATQATQATHWRGRMVPEVGPGPPGHSS